MQLTCPICKSRVEETTKESRSGRKIKLGSCKNCDFLFSNIDNINSLKKNQLDKTRLKDAGLKIPTIEKDFKNGSKQSEYYFEEYIRGNDIPLDILEIGCSWGYFLNTLKSKNHKVTGVEISGERRKYVETILKIKCFENEN